MKNYEFFCVPVKTSILFKLKNLEFQNVLIVKKTIVNEITVIHMLN